MSIYVRPFIPFTPLLAGQRPVAGSLEEGVGEVLHLALYDCAFVYDGNKHGYIVTNAVRESLEGKG